MIQLTLQFFDVDQHAERCLQDCVWLKREGFAPSGFCLSLSLAPKIPSLAPFGPFTLAVVTLSTLGSSLLGAWTGAWLSSPTSTTSALPSSSEVPEQPVCHCDCGPQAATNGQCLTPATFLALTGSTQFLSTTTTASSAPARPSKPKTSETPCPHCVPLVVLTCSHFGAVILGIILWEITKVFYRFTTAVVRITENTDPALLDRRRPVFALPGRTYGGGSPDRHH